MYDEEYKGDVSETIVVPKDVVGKTVPEDVSVVGFDGIDLCRFSIPRLTTVEQPVDEIARRSVNLLLDMMEKGAAPRHITVKAVFRSRDSVAPPRIVP